MERYFNYERAEEQRLAEIVVIDQLWLDRLERYHPHLKTRVVRQVYENPIGPKITPLSRQQQRRLAALQAHQDKLDLWRESVMRKAAECKAEPDPIDTSPSIETLQKFVARNHNMSVAELLRKGKKRHKTKARNHLWYMLRVERGMSYPQIAERYGYDHTTIIHGIRNHCKDNDLKFPSLENAGYLHSPAERRKAIREPELFG